LTTRPRPAVPQASALKREEERKQIVEETLAKLRAEREERLRKRSGSSVDIPAPPAAGPGPRVPPLQRHNSGGSKASAQQAAPTSVRGARERVVAGGNGSVLRTKDGWGSL
jgi:hypothetical protein